MPIVRRHSLPSALAACLASVSCGALNDLVQSPSSFAIQKFTATPKELQPGGATTLTWEVAGAESVQIDNGVGPVGALAGARPFPAPARAAAWWALAAAFLVHGVARAVLRLPV